MAEHTFVLGGPHETRITVVSQQIRAINLAVALSVSGLLEGAAVGVVGAGAGGSTFAAAAALLGADVDLYDEHEEPISTQRWSFDRYLHPNLFDWPVEGWDQDSADLPIVNWSAGPSAETRLEMLTGFAFAAKAGEVTWHPQHCISEIRETAGKVKVTVCDLRATAEQPPPTMTRLFDKEYAIVVVATGFLPETTIRHTDASGSYWKDQGLPAAIGARHVIIIGDGDGALTELLLLTVCRASGAAAHEMLHTIAHEIYAAHDQVGKILEIESSLSGSRGRGSLEEYSHGFADGWTPDVRSPVSIEIRTGRVALRRTSFAINRFVAAQLTRYHSSSIRFVQGAFHETSDAQHLQPADVIWRTGPRARVRTVLVKPALTVRAAGDAMARDPEYQDVIGTVDQLMDYTRQRLWGQASALAHPMDGSAVEALAAIEVRSAPQDAFDAPWPGFVEQQSDVDLTRIIARMADLADHLGETDGRSSNFNCHRAFAHGVLVRVADLSLDMVGAAADLTPTEVVHQVRVGDGRDNIELVRVKVNPSNQDVAVDRLWVRRVLREEGQPRPGLDPAVEPKSDYTLVSLLLAPAFAVADVVATDRSGSTRFRKFSAPAGLNDAKLESLVFAVARKRDRVERGERTDAMVRLLRLIAGGEADAERALMTDVWRMLESADDLDVRRGLISLAAILTASESPSKLTTDHLAELSDATPDAALAQVLLQAAFGRLVRHLTGTPLERNDAHLLSFMGELLPGGTVPAPASFADTAFLQLARFGLAWEAETA